MHSSGAPAYGDEGAAARCSSTTAILDPSREKTCRSLIQYVDGGGLGRVIDRQPHLDWTSAGTGTRRRTSFRKFPTSPASASLSSGRLGTGLLTQSTRQLGERYLSEAEGGFPVELRTPVLAGDIRPYAHQLGFSRPIG